VVPVSSGDHSRSGYSPHAVIGGDARVVAGGGTKANGGRECWGRSRGVQAPPPATPSTPPAHLTNSKNPKIQTDQQACGRPLFLNFWFDLPRVCCSGPGSLPKSERNLARAVERPSDPSNLADEPGGTPAHPLRGQHRSTGEPVFVTLLADERYERWSQLSCAIVRRWPCVNANVIRAVSAHSFSKARRSPSETRSTEYPSICSLSLSSVSLLMPQP